MRTTTTTRARARRAARGTGSFRTPRRPRRVLPAGVAPPPGVADLHQQGGRRRGRADLPAAGLHGALRRRFLEDCREELLGNGAGRAGGDAADPTDEAHALHVCRLAKFLLEGYDRAEMERVVLHDRRERENHLPTLFYLDLISYMKRRGRALTTASVPARKVCGSCSALCLPCVRLSHTCMLVRFNSPLVHRKQLFPPPPPPPPPPPNSTTSSP